MMKTKNIQHPKNIYYILDEKIIIENCKN